MKIKHLAIAVSIAAASLSASATVINFDDFQQESWINNGYGSLNWSNFRVLNGHQLPQSGYFNGMVSEKNVAYNANGFPASFSSGSAFTFNSLYLTAAWNDDLNLKISGYRNGTLVNETSFLLSTASPILKTLNWTNIDTVEFVTSGGIHHGGYSGQGTHFAADNLTINEPVISAVPEPETYAMLLAGVGLLGGIARRRKQK